MAIVEVKVPDIGDFKDVPVIDVLVKPGDTVEPEDPLVTLESDKATMDVPAPAAGTVASLSVKIGDKVSEGSPLLKLETGAAKPPAEPARAAPAATDASAPAAGASSLPLAAPTRAPTAAAAPTPSAQRRDTAAGGGDVECEMLVLGAGPGGYSAAFRAADLGMKTVLVERYHDLGGVCLNVGCIPSKALLHVAAVMDEVKTMAAHGVAYGSPQIDLDKLRDFRKRVVRKLTAGIAAMARARKVEVVHGIGRFVDAHRLHVDLTSGKGRATTGESRTIRFEKAIIAAGSQAIALPFMPDDPRIVDATGALELPLIPKRMLVVGGGIIGLEMASVYASLGSRIDIVEMLDGVMAGADRDLVRVWERKNAGRFDNVMLKTKTVSAKAAGAGIEVAFEGEKAPSGPKVYDLVLVAVGRRPNGKAIDAAQAGVAVDERGFIRVDRQMRTNVDHVFAIGDIAGAPMLAHKAVHEGHVAAEAASGMKSFFDARQIPSVAYTDPEVAWTGVTEDECRARSVAYRKAVFPWTASGRAIANAREEGQTKLLFDAETHRIIGGGIVGTHAGDLISEIGLAIEMGCDAVDIGRTIHPHPTLSESIGMAAEAFEGVCTDLPPPRNA
ncbi:MAG: dihydrolipoyl dehydrogenase [Rudaea sp.]